MTRTDLWDVRWFIAYYASQGYDNSFMDLSFERDFSDLLDLIKDPEDNLPEDYKVDEKKVREFLTRIRDGIDKWLNKKDFDDEEDFE